MNREKVKKFWYDRAQAVNVPRPESLVNFQRDAVTADLYLKTELAVINAELPLKNSDVLVDLGAGNGRFSLLFAPKVRKVAAVEYIEGFAAEIAKQARERGYTNIEVLNSPAEDFCVVNSADVIFVSGLLHYLDNEQYDQTVNNISKTLKPGGILFLRETISVLENEFIVDKFSEELGAYYCSIYRTGGQHIETLSQKQFMLLKAGPFFENGSIFNKRLETHLHYFIFQKRIPRINSDIKAYPEDAGY
ncbi:MAG: class I SAM-dependent methyltransferase [Oscillospiraceae bacterium]|jgi:precorrin-6B methylase 2|nr:class I SAM-dependent methyltransferase [Oscillospiraceae bacterium]